MGLKTNLGKTKVMVCTPGFIWGKRGELVYKRLARREGETFRYRKKTRVSCTMCGVTVAEYYLKTNTERSHGICVPQTRGADELGGGPYTYAVYFPRVLQEVKCLVPGCPSEAHSAGRLHEHFIYRHFKFNVVVVQERMEPLPCYELYRMHIPAGRLIRHRRTARCKKTPR